MPVVNLDRMPTQKLWEFADRHRFGQNYKLLGEGPRAAKDAALLSEFAGLKHSERILIEEFKDVPNALTFRFFAERVYKRISPDFQWRLRLPREASE